MTNLDKTSLRHSVRAKLAELPNDCSELDRNIVQNLQKLICSWQHTPLAAYMALPKEPNLIALLRKAIYQNRELYIPRYVSETRSYEMVLIRDLDAQLQPGKYGILEPKPSLTGAQPPFSAPLNWIWLVPAIAFDPKGNRLGRGAGFYDRLLQGANGVKIGVAYECQLVDAIPSQDHDIPMDYVVTETHVRNCDDWQ